MKSGVSFIIEFWIVWAVKMYAKVFVMCWAVACVFTAPPTDVVPLEKQQPTVIPIVSQSAELEPNGTYKFSYETGNGIKREEISYDKIVPKAEGRSASSNEGGESDESDEIHVQQGSYSYTAPDGTLITLRYIADENGFQPIGDHLPKAPALVQASTSSAEKTGRALKPQDNSEAGSAPAVVARTGTSAKDATAPEDPNSPAPESDGATSESKPESAESTPVPTEAEMSAETEGNAVSTTAQQETTTTPSENASTTIASSENASTTIATESSSTETTEQTSTTTLASVEQTSSESVEPITSTQVPETASTQASEETSSANEATTVSSN